MMIKNQRIFEKALIILRDLYGKEAEFREGQYEAIRATLLNNRTLIVQKTGWGKSLVYFSCTKILRSQGKGVTLVVSPLLVLMQNQIEAAVKLGLKCDVLNSTVKDREEEIIRSLINDELDLILVTPEALFKEVFQNSLKDIKIGLFVIDEAHCISDWGHDFRLEYGNLFKILKQLPISVPILGTTATANNRVVDDLKKQLG
ncbi:MAG: DEAD/DEAH box helicase, partial [Oscillospiraceae bacterium]|nr:DEAD/DEAH box helicase [Oscillospiraceae bacterium]